jgi:hypothetical protein
MKTKTKEDEVMCALIRQVAKAVPCGGNEPDVRTYITRPMWKLWCIAVGIPLNAKPGPWNSVNSFRVYGSETVIVESPHFLSWSEAINA